MKKEDRQVKGEESIGCYYGKKLFRILVFPLNGEILLCLSLYDLPIKIRLYSTVKAAKRGAERFLRRLQEAVK